MQISDLRVALFTGNYNYVRDGANQALNRLVAYLLAEGAAVRIYSPTVAEPAFPAVGDLVPVPAIPLPGRAEYRAPLGLTPALRRDIHQFAPNIIHVASPEKLGHSASAFARRNRIALVASVHTRFETYPRYYGLTFLEPVVEWLLRRFYRRCDAIFAPSESMAQLLRDQRMSYNVGIWSRGVDREIFSPDRRDLAWRRSLGIGDDEVVIGFVGRLVMEKGLDVYSEAIDLLVSRGVPHRVLIVGEGPARPWFEARLPDNAVFAGFQSGADLGRAYASMEMLFNPSVTETFGNVTLEAMAAGLPVIAAEATGSLSLVVNGVSGALVRPGAVARFADALAQFCRDESARVEAGAAGLKLSERFGWKAVNHVLADGYLNVLRARQRGPRG